MSKGLFTILSILFVLTSSSAFATDLPEGCFSGAISKGLYRSSTVRVRITHIQGKRYQVSADWGEEAGPSCYRSATVKWNRSLKKFIGKGGAPCDEGGIRSTVTLARSGDAGIRYKRETVFFIGAGGGGYVYGTSRGIAAVAAEFCSDLL